MPYRRILLNIFFLLPAWVIRIFVWKKDTYIRGQVLDFKSSLLIAMTPSSLLTKVDFVDDLRIAINEARIASPVSLKPSQKVKTFDHKLLSEEATILLREYEPKTISTKKVILYFHGGGYVLGGIESHDAALQFFAAEIGSKIFSLEYRLAPENKFPSSLQDANLALEWLGKTLNLSISEISLCGDSAGGHLSASLSTYRAINNLELPLSQCLIYPMTDPLSNSKSHVDFASGFLLSQKAMIWFWEQLMNSRENLNDPVFNLTIDPKVNLPKTLIITAGFDPLSDEGEAYARLLDNTGNEVQQIHYPHLIHGFVNMTALNAAKDATKDLLKTYKKFLK